VKDAAEQAVRQAIADATDEGEATEGWDKGAASTIGGMAKAVARADIDITSEHISHSQS
jgi:hypothetical protein